MGYDFQTLQPPTEVPADYEPVYPGRPDLYQVRTSAMRVLFEIMEAAGVLDSSLSRPEFPRWPPRFTSERTAEAIRIWLEEGGRRPWFTFPWQERAVRVHLQRLEEIAQIRWSTPGLVPWFKFASNDDWLVHPEECEAISSGLQSGLQSRADEILPAEGEDSPPPSVSHKWATHWAQFNAIAAKCGGYRVS